MSCATSRALRALVLVVVPALGLSACGSSLRFRHESVLRAVLDEASGSSRVSLSFEVWDGPTQVTGLTPESFTVFEDGQPATSESFAAARTSEHRVPVVLLLDTSLSMYQAHAVEALTEAARRFQRVLSENGFEVLVYRFASQIATLSSIDEVPDTFDEVGGERWTSLYAAVARGLSDRPDAILVVFSDGADNYSQNHGVSGLSHVERDVLPTELGGTGAQRVIHTIGFGDVQGERDRQGVLGGEALERLARNGSFHYARDPSALDVVFHDVADRIRNVYTFDYFSPNLSGAHQVWLEVRVDRRVARSTSMWFTASRYAPADPGGVDLGAVPAGTCNRAVACCLALGQPAASCEGMVPVEYREGAAYQPACAQWFEAMERAAIDMTRCAP